MHSEGPEVGDLQAGVQGDAELGSHSEDIVNSLIQMLHDPDTGVASSAAAALCAPSSAHGALLCPLHASLPTQQQMLSVCP